MGSHDQWPPVTLASAGRGSIKINGNKRNFKESQQETLRIVNEMFSTTLEPAVILSVVQNCNWELQPSIEGLITLSETVENPASWNETRAKMGGVGPELFFDIENSDETAMKKNLETNNAPCPPQSLPTLETSRNSAVGQKWAKPKRTGAKNRMDFFCDNIARLKSSGDGVRSQEYEKKACKIEEERENSAVHASGEFSFDEFPVYGATGGEKFSETKSSPLLWGDFPENAIISSPEPSPGKKVAPRNRGWRSGHESSEDSERGLDDNRPNRNHESNNREVASLEKRANSRRNEPESLCGLKVQYRLGGMSSSSDDDADVVIEDESSDYAINLMPETSTSVSQFLSASTQTLPKRTKPEIQMISTPSPPQTPQRNLHEARLGTIKESINRGEKILILMRGLPGSGKTTLAESIVATTIAEHPSSHIFSTDDFFVNLGRGKYEFVPTKLSDAHATNQRRVSSAMRQGRSPIIVDNTNIEAWEMRPYATAAVANGYIVEILEPNTPWSRNPKVLAHKNTHNVPKEKIVERASRFENITSGDRLLEIYALKYSPDKQPPLLRNQPSLEAVDRLEIMTKSAGLSSAQSNWDNDHENPFVLTSHDIESMQNIDETHNSLNFELRSSAIDDEPSEPETNARPEISSKYADKVLSDYLEVLHDSDDESFEMLEANGSENLSDIGKSLEVEAPLNRRYAAEESEEASDEPGQCSTDDNLGPNNSQQTLGAIGSERKGSLSIGENMKSSKAKESGNNGNVLSQCWDFTLIIGSHRLHSRHGNYVSPLSNPGKKSAEDCAEDIVTSGDDGDGGDEESEEKISSGDDRNADEKGIEIEAQRTMIPGADDEGDDETEEMAGELNGVGEKAEKNIPPKVSNGSPVGTNPREKNSEDEIVTSEERKMAREESSSTTAIGSFLNLIKTSILGAYEESSTEIFDKPSSTEDLDNFVTFEHHEQENSQDESTNVKHEESLNDDKKMADHKEDLINENQGILINLDFVDFSMMEKLDGTTGEIVAPKNLESPEHIFEKTESPLERFFINTFDDETPAGVEKIPTHLLTDNISSISWKESPFPVDGNQLSRPLSHEDNTTVAKTDAGTMTTLYDFNVAYVGGTSEPGYRELWGVNRSINDAKNRMEKIVKRDSKKITFDKSSMTGESDILANPTNPNSEKEKDPTNRLGDLLEMFPNYPREYLKALYEQQCNCNFDWVVDVLLLADAPDSGIENYEEKGKVVKKEEKTVVDLVKLWKMENEIFKQRPHRSSPRNRRNRAKDYRSFSLEFPDHRYSTGREICSGNDCDNIGQDDEEDKILDLFYAKAVSETNFSDFKNELPDSSFHSPASEINDNLMDDENEETVELNCGKEFIDQLEKSFGNADFSLPDELKPFIKIKKSMMEEIYGLWIRSMDDQIKALHAQLDERMARDEAMARAVDFEETSQPREAVVPNLEEIMNMEMALAKYQNELKEKVARETPDDMASRLTRRTLYELLPEMDQQTLSDILKAHHGNFKETCEIIEANIGRKISESDTSKKQQSLLDRVSEERKNQDIKRNSENTKKPLIVVNPDTYARRNTERSDYEDAIQRGLNARMEAQRQFSLRIENYNKAAEAYRKGYPEAAAYYSQIVNLHTQEIRAAHENAATEFLSAQTHGKDGDDTLDLHNLFVREAVQALDVFLDYQLKKLNQSNKKSTTLFIVTGHGTRSNNGIGKIKPAVSKKLTRRNIRFTEANAGCFKVTLSRKNDMLN